MQRRVVYCGMPAHWPSVQAFKPCVGQSVLFVHVYVQRLLLLQIASVPPRPHTVSGLLQTTPPTGLLASRKALQLLGGAQNGPGALSTDDACTVLVNGLDTELALDAPAQPAARLYAHTISLPSATHFMVAPHSLSAAQFPQAVTDPRLVVPHVCVLRMQEFAPQVLSSMHGTHVPAAA
jgi:hypothetical protein